MFRWRVVGWIWNVVARPIWDCFQNQGIHGGGGSAAEVSWSCLAGIWMLLLCCAQELVIWQVQQLAFIVQNFTGSFVHWDAGSILVSGARLLCLLGILKEQMFLALGLNCAGYTNLDFWKIALIPVNFAQLVGNVFFGPFLDAGKIDPLSSGHLISLLLYQSFNIDLLFLIFIVILDFAHKLLRPQYLLTFIVGVHSHHQVPIGEDPRILTWILIDQCRFCLCLWRYYRIETLSFIWLHFHLLLLLYFHLFHQFQMPFLYVFHFGYSPISV